MGATPRPCEGLSGQCVETAEHRVSWKEVGYRWRRRARLCGRCLHTLRGKALVSDVVHTQLGARPAADAGGRHRADDGQDDA